MIKKTGKKGGDVPNPTTKYEIPVYDYTGKEPKYYTENVSYDPLKNATPKALKKTRSFSSSVSSSKGTPAPSPQPSIDAFSHQEAKTFAEKFCPSHGYTTKVGGMSKMQYKAYLAKMDVKRLYKMAKNKGIKITKKKDGKTSYIKKDTVIQKLCDALHGKKK